jgi:hypothetical protein
MLGVRPVMGRTFARDEERPDTPPTALISYGLWMRRFGGDPQLVGRTIALSGAPTTVIGVLPAGFRFEFPTRRDIDVWVPRIVPPDAREARRSRGLYVVGHLRPGVSAVMARLAAAHPLSNGGWDVRFVPLQDQIGGTARTPLVVLLAAAACLLLIVCANLGTTVVGIVGDVRHAALQADPEPEIYVPQAQDPSMHMYAAVRSNTPPATLARALTIRRSSSQRRSR